MKNRKRVWVPLLVLLLVAAIWYSRPVTLPDLLKDQELQEINVLIRSLGDWTQEPETATVSVPPHFPRGGGPAGTAPRPLLLPFSDRPANQAPCSGGECQPWVRLL